MINFDPNARTFKKRQHVYATYIPDRSPAFKTHWNLGQAKNAITYMQRPAGAIMYRLVDDQWVECFKMNPDDYHIPEHCTNCWADMRSLWSAKMKWSGTPEDGLTLNWVCRHCH